MADPVVTLDTERVLVEPGGQAQISVTILNSGDIVEGYRLDVLGDGASRWAEAVPPEVSIYPGQSATAVVVLSPPPAPETATGTWPFGVRVRSLVDADAVAVAEGAIEVGKQFGLHAKILPVTSTGRWGGRHAVRITNWGNVSVRLTLQASDPDLALGFLVRPPAIDLPLGSEVVAHVRVRTRKPFLRGTPVRLPFTIVGEPDHPASGPPQRHAPGTMPDRPVVSGAFYQKPIIGSAVVFLAVLAAAALLGAFGLAFTRPRQPVLTDLAAGVPAAPTLSGRPVSADAIELTWQPVPRIEKYTVVRVDPKDSTKLFGVAGVDRTATLQLMSGLAPASLNCFRLKAVNGKFESPLSNEVCKTTLSDVASASPVPSTTESGSSTSSSKSPSAAESGNAPKSPSPSGESPLPVRPVPPAEMGQRWIAVSAAEVDTILPPRVEQLVTEITSLGLPAGTLLSREYPRLQLERVKNPSYVFFAGPYPDRATAEAACLQIDRATPTSTKLPCEVVQPAPAR
jgi:hypothetical protein